MHNVGKIGHFALFDLFYHCSREDWAPGALRSLLIKTGPDQFREVHFQEASGKVFPTEILHIGHENIIQLNFDDYPADDLLHLSYYSVSDQGFQPIDFGPAKAAATKVMPVDEFLYWPTISCDFKRMVYTEGTEESGKNTSAQAGCCDGRVEVPFRIENGKVIAGQAKYYPNFF